MMNIAICVLLYAAQHNKLLKYSAFSNRQYGLFNSAKLLQLAIISYHIPIPTLKSFDDFEKTRSISFEFRLVCERERFLLLRPVIYGCNNGQIGVLNNIIKMSYHFEIIILIIWAIVSAETNYRHMFIDSSELCENTFAPKPIRTGGGAIILQLSKPKVQFQPSQKISKSCEIRFKVTSIFYLFIIIFAFISVGILSSIWVKCFLWDEN